MVAVANNYDRNPFIRSETKKAQMAYYADKLENVGLTPL